MIDMFVGMGQSKQTPFFENQSSTMITLLFIIVACLPILLLARPLLEKHHDHHVEEENEAMPLLGVDIHDEVKELA
jgi:hypothetical protein